MDLSTLPQAARKPVRLSITIPHGLYCRIEQQASSEGRSMSNLAAYLLEASLPQAILRENARVAPGGSSSPLQCSATRPLRW